MSTNSNINIKITHTDDDEDFSSDSEGVDEIKVPEPVVVVPEPVVVAPVDVAPVDVVPNEDIVEQVRKMFSSKIKSFYKSVKAEYADHPNFETHMRQLKDMFDSSFASEIVQLVPVPVHVPVQQVVVAHVAPVQQVVATTSSGKGTRAASGYSIWQKHMTAQTSGMTAEAKRIFKGQQKSWSEMSDAEKKPFMDQAVALKASAPVQQVVVAPVVVPVQQAQVVVATTSSGKGTRAASGYSIWQKHMTAQTNGMTAEAKRIFKGQQKSWSEMSDDEKKPFMDQAAALKAASA